MCSEVSAPDERNHCRIVRRLRTAAVLFALAAVLGCGSTGPFTWFSDLPKTEWGAHPAEYIIGVGDGLSVKIYEQENLGAAVKVRNDGRIALALVGEVVAAGKHPSQLARELEGRYKEFIVSPRVTVNVELSQPVQVSVVGEVGKTGTLALEPPATLLQAVAQSGGPNEYADKSKIFVIRRVPEFRRIRFTYDALLENKAGAAMFALRTGDIVLVE
jgi:polysaccharide export outer membrane protein